MWISSMRTAHGRTPTGRNHGRAGNGRAPGQGALCRHFIVQSGTDTRGGAILKSEGVPLLIHQPSYSMFNRWIEKGLLETLDELGVGCIAFSPLAQGLLTGKYLNGIPETRAPQAEGSFYSKTSSTRKPRARPRAQRNCARAAARRWRRWPSPGFCAIPA